MPHIAQDETAIKATPESPATQSTVYPSTSKSLTLSSIAVLAFFATALPVTALYANNPSTVFQVAARAENTNH